MDLRSSEPCSDTEPPSPRQAAEEEECVVCAKKGPKARCHPCGCGHSCTACTQRWGRRCAFCKELVLFAVGPRGDCVLPPVSTQQAEEAAEGHRETLARASEQETAEQGVLVLGPGVAVNLDTLEGWATATAEQRNAVVGGAMWVANDLQRRLEEEAHRALSQPRSFPRGSASFQRAVLLLTEHVEARSAPPLDASVRSAVADGAREFRGIERSLETYALTWDAFIERYNQLLARKREWTHPDSQEVLAGLLSLMPPAQGEAPTVTAIVAEAAEQASSATLLIRNAISAWCASASALMELVVDVKDSRPDKAAVLEMILQGAETLVGSYRTRNLLMGREAPGATELLGDRRIDLWLQVKQLNTRTRALVSRNQRRRQREADFREEAHTERRRRHRGDRGEGARKRRWSP